MAGLTNREISIIKLVCEGKYNKEIAFDLKLTECTVKTYLVKIFKKLNMKSRTELAVWACKHVSLIFIFVCFSLGQTINPGTVNIVTTVTITSAAGVAPTNIGCNFTGNPTTAQITVNCNGNGATLSSTLPIPLPAPGTIGNFSLSGNTITWGFVPFNSSSVSGLCPAGITAPATCWQVVANGTVKTGAF